MIVSCDFCQAALDTLKDRWLFQDDGSYIHIACIEPALAEYVKFLDQEIASHDLKLLSKFDPREPFILENWKETCEWCGTITQSPNETHVCSERV
jgi:hypothetical protein